MGLLSNPAFGPRVALIYVTLGAVIDVWIVVYLFTVARGVELTSWTWFWLAGLFFTGLTLIVLGLLLGPIGRAARKAELPPTEATRTEAQIQANAAATPDQVVPNQVVTPTAVPQRPPGLAYPVGPAPVVAPQG